MCEEAETFGAVSSSTLIRVQKRSVTVRQCLTLADYLCILGHHHGLYQLLGMLPGLNQQLILKVSKQASLLQIGPSTIPPPQIHTQLCEHIICIQLQLVNPECGRIKHQ